MTLLLLIAPGVIASLYYSRQKGIPLKSVEFIVYTIIYAFLINLFIAGIIYLRGHKDVPSTEIFSILGNATRYGAIGLILALAFPNIALLLEKIGTRKKK